ncbi:hypothetical protein D030_4221B, partial [Vibrio parahaemolyticus AQ3810]
QHQLSGLPKPSVINFFDFVFG